MIQSKEKNIINRQIIDLYYTGTTNPIQLRREVEWLCKENLIPQIELLLDKWNIPGRTIRIDKLQVEINDLL